MIKRLHAFLSSITMYRLMLYYLLVLVGAGIGASALKLLPYQGLDILTSALYFSLVCYISNQLCALLFRAKTNIESQFITALILTLITGPGPLSDNLVPFTILGVVAMSSKYIIALRRQHIFNPAALAVTAGAFIAGGGASWWVGNTILLPFVLLGGLLVAQKIRRYGLIGAFAVVYLALLSLTTVHNGINILFGQLSSIMSASPLLFFCFVMLIEPLTAPQKRSLRIYFGVLVGLCLFAFQRWLPIPYTLELALLCGNVFARIVERSGRLTLHLERKELLDTNIMAFWFAGVRQFAFNAGQFLEYTLPHAHPDSRGVRRFFTIASSPTEEGVMLATKFPETPSSFKKALREANVGEEMSASHVSGDFTLPKRPLQPLVFIAGGIGITPFRSIIKYMLDTELRYPVTLFYSNKTADEIVFADVFSEAEKRLNTKVVYTLTEKEKIPSGWKGRVGFVDAGMIMREVPAYKDCVFYLSGPEGMVRSFEKMLADLGVARQNIKRDYFPGYE